MEELTQEYLKEILRFENGILYWKVASGSRAKAGNIAGSKNKVTGYIDITINKKQYRAHRIIYFIHYGYISKDLYIDHINSDRKQIIG